MGSPLGHRLAPNLTVWENVMGTTIRLILTILLAGAFMCATISCEKDSFEKAGKKVDKSLEDAKKDAKDKWDKVKKEIDQALK